MSEEKNKTPGRISRREFLKDAGIVVGGTAVGSAFFLSACGKEVEVTKTVTTTKTNNFTTTAPGTTSTVTTTAPGSTHTQTITKYICPACNQEFSSLDDMKAHYDSLHEMVDDSSNLIKLTVNGWPYEVKVDPEEVLRDTLREKLGFTSIKDMCNGYGACGSCSIIMNGRPVLSCLLLAAECDGANIETAEGVAESNPDLLDAYVMNHCMQCGYCTPGFIVTTKALLDHNPNPIEDEIRQALGGNICRCGTYPAHINAINEVVKG